MQSDSRHEPSGDRAGCRHFFSSNLEGVSEQPTTCDFCGRQGTGAETLTWTTSVENGRQRTYCEECSRTHLRAIEGKLDSEWW
jgi:hypothetical protein